MDMIIAELHEQSRELYKRANYVLLSSIKLEGKDTLPALTSQDEEAIARLSSEKDVLTEAHAIRLAALTLKMSVLDHRLQYPTEAALHRRLWRACQSTAMAMEAEARLMRKADGESKLYCSLIDESRALHREAEAHLELADDYEQKLK